MIRTSTLGLSLLACTAALGGCHSAPDRPAATISLGQLGPSPAEMALESRAGGDGSYFFGAGDSLGREVFRYYVASLDTADQRYATGESGFLDHR